MADATLYHVMIPSGLETDSHVHLTLYSSHETEAGAVARAEEVRAGGCPVVHVCRVELTTLHVLDSAVTKTTEPCAEGLRQDPLGQRVRRLLGR